MSDQILDKILLKVIGIEEQLKNTSTKDDLSIAKSKILGDVDGFIKFHETLDLELSALKS